MEISGMEFFTICRDKKFAKCEECAKIDCRGGDNIKSFTTLVI